MITKTKHLSCSKGFTLLELIIAVMLLTAFILPMLQLMADARVRAVRYTHLRQVRELAQQKLHDRVHYYEEYDSGTFEEEGEPLWTWEVSPPEIRSQGTQVILQYQIVVSVPFSLGELGESGDSESALSGSAEGGSTYEYTLWALPHARWYEEQQYLWEQGQFSPLHGYPEDYYESGSRRNY